MQPPAHIMNSVIKELEAELNNNVANAGQAFHTVLEIYPELAKCPEIVELCIRYLDSAALGYRRYAALVLIAAGNPQGILHLTYNALSNHPKLKQDQTKISGWNDAYLMRNASHLTEECIDLLIRDTINSGYFHGDVLALASPELVTDKMLTLLDMPFHISLQAAYVLARKGRAEGKHLLEKIADEIHVLYLELALIGLSHLRDDSSLRIINEYADPKHPVYHPIVPELAINGWLSENELLTKAKQRADICNQVPFQQVMEKYYFSDMRGNFELQKIHLPIEFEANFYSSSNHFVTSAQDLIAEFSTDSDRKELARTQDSKVRELLEYVPLDSMARGNWSGFMWWARVPRDSRSHITPSSYYLRGVSVINEADDYLFAATDWLLNPQFYLRGSQRPLDMSLDRP